MPFTIGPVIKYWNLSAATLPKTYKKKLVKVLSTKYIETDV